MKIGNRVIISSEILFDEIHGRRGVIIDEKVPNSQIAMLCGISNYVIKLDEPVVLQHGQFSEITLPAHALIRERGACV